ncbi:MAG: cyclic nucleotide-binding domain-containing protein, partial [Pseudomonadota bacterium]
MQHIMFETGQTIFSQGEPSKLTYRIIAGSVDIVVETQDGAEKRIASLGPDDIFGEMGIIDDSPRSATAIAREQTACQAYTAEEVIDLLTSNPEEAIDLIRSLILRLRSTN